MTCMSVSDMSGVPGLVRKEALLSRFSRGVGAEAGELSADGKPV